MKKELRHDPTLIHETLGALLADGEVLELRALEVRTREGAFATTLSGYFSDPAALAEAADRIHGASGIYITANPVDPALLARAANRARPCGRGTSTTTDREILHRRFLFVDCDAVRPSGISATDAEKAAALERAERVARDLIAEGWPDPILADSGNGAHLLFLVDLPADDDGLLKQVTLALSEKYSDDVVKIDRTTGNAARLIPLYGTVKAKGDATPDRPHRLTRILRVPASRTSVPAELLRQTANVRRPSSGGAGSGEYLDNWIDKYFPNGLRGPEPWNGGLRWVIPVCPFNPSHDRGEAVILKLPSGAISAMCHHDSCTWSWPDLREKHESKAAGRTDKTDKTPSGSSVSTHPPTFEASSREEWPDPIPLPDELPPVPSFDLDLLPTPFRPWIEDTVDRMQCPPDYPAVGAMVVCAGLVGCRAAIRPKRWDDWQIVPNLWGALVGRPGVQKTPALREPLRILETLEREAGQEYAAKVADAEIHEAIAREHKARRKKAITAALRKGQDPDTIAASLPEQDEVQTPIRQRFLTNDATVEKLGELLRDNPNGLVVVRDELVGFLRGLDKEGHEGARAFYLEAWNGTGPFVYDRIGRGTVEIPRAIVSLLGCIQPGPLRSYLWSSTRNAGDDGLMQRFQLLVWPDVSPSWTNIDRVPNLAARMRAEATYRQLKDIDFRALGAEVTSSSECIPFFRFSDEAQEAFDAWRAELEVSMRRAEHNAALESHRSKYRSLIPSLALLIHLADIEHGPVPIQALSKALRWGDYLLAHARRVYAAVEAPEFTAASALLRRIREGDVGPIIDKREVYRKGWSNLASPTDVQAALNMLEEHSMVRKLVTSDTGGAPRTRYQVNPKALRMPRGGPDKTDKTARPEVMSVLSGPVQPVGSSDGAEAQQGVDHA